MPQAAWAAWSLYNPGNTGSKGRAQKLGRAPELRQAASNHQPQISLMGLPDWEAWPPTRKNQTRYPGALGLCDSAYFCLRHRIRQADVGRGPRDSYALIWLQVTFLPSCPQSYLSLSCQLTICQAHSIQPG